MANRTYMRVDGAQPLSGIIPLNFHVWGYLIGINPDGSEGGLGGKPIRLVVNGYVVWNGTTGIAPSHPNGWMDLSWWLREGGTYDIYVEFLGDGTWDACRTDTYRVTVSKKTTYLRIDGAEPLSGVAPLDFHMWGYLMGVNADGSEGGLAGKPIRLVVDDGVVWRGTTGVAPAQPDGWIDVHWSLTSGTHQVYVDYEGDDEWLDCKSNVYAVAVSKKTTYIRVDGATPLSGSVPLAFHLWGYLIGVNPNGSEGGLGGKTLRLIVNGTSVWSGTTGIAPSNPDGWMDLGWTLSEPGTYEIYVEAVEDAEWLGCQSPVSTVTVQKQATTMFVRQSIAQKGGIWFEGELQQEDGTFPAGKEVDLYVDGVLATSCITYRKMLTLVTWLDGHWEFSYELPVGTYKVYARFSGDSMLEPSQTEERQIEVTEAKKFDPLEAIWAALRDAAKKVGLPAPPKPPSLPALPIPGG